MMEFLKTVEKIELKQLHMIFDAIQHMQPKINACLRPIFL